MIISGGSGEVRTPDIRLVRATLSQLSYTPTCVLHHITSSAFDAITFNLAV